MCWLRGTLLLALAAGSTSSRAESSAYGGSLQSIQLSTRVIHDYGLIRNKVNPFEEGPAFRAPPSRQWAAGAMNLGLFRSLRAEGQYIAFVGNTTGNNYSAGFFGRRRRCRQCAAVSAAVGDERLLDVGRRRVRPRVQRERYRGDQNDGPK